METRRLQTELLVHAGRLLLEYNESAGEIHRALTATAAALTGDACQVAVSYNGVAVSLAGAPPSLLPVRELRYNTALQARVHEVLVRVRRGEVGAEAALEQLKQAEADTPRHPRWVAALALAG